MSIVTTKSNEITEMLDEILIKYEITNLSDNIYYQVPDAHDDLYHLCDKLEDALAIGRHLTNIYVVFTDKVCDIVLFYFNINDKDNLTLRGKELGIQTTEGFKHNSGDVFDMGGRSGLEYIKDFIVKRKLNKFVSDDN